MGLGERDRAFEWLGKAIEKNEEGLSEQFLQPFYQNLYTDGRWQSFLERVGSSPERLSGIEFNVALPD